MIKTAFAGILSGIYLSGQTYAVSLVRAARTLAANVVSVVTDYRCDERVLESKDLSRVSPNE